LLGDCSVELAGRVVARGVALGAMGGSVG